MNKKNPNKIHGSKANLPDSNSNWEVVIVKTALSMFKYKKVWKRKPLEAGWIEQPFN